VCDETKTLCYQFESIVTNSSLSFRDIAFLEINQELAAILKLSELGDVDWKSLLDNFSDIGSNFTKDNLQEQTSTTSMQWESALPQQVLAMLSVPLSATAISTEH
jgi:hypothetical protein